jgi:hypothetical protein
LFRFQGNLIVVLIVVTTIVTESINGILVTKTHVGVSHTHFLKHGSKNKDMCNIYT